MTSNVQSPTMNGPRATPVCILTFLLLPALSFSQPVVSLSSSDGPPTMRLTVSGSGFTPSANIDLYFDAHDEALAVADGSGSFSGIAIQVPASALPGIHWVSAVPRSGQSSAQAQFLTETQWNQFHRGNMQRYNEFENVLNVDNVRSLRMKWVKYIGAPIYSPSLGHDGLYAALSGRNMVKMDPDTGSSVWSYYNFPHGGTTPAIANGVVYFGDTDHNVYALNAKDGSILWSYLTGDEVESSPAIVNGVVYIGSLDYSVYALNARTGSKLWSYTTGSEVRSSPAVTNGVVYVRSDDGNIYALNAGTGVKLWNYSTTAGYGWSSPGVANGIVYFGSQDNNIYAVSAATGARLWSYNTGSPISNCSPAVANEVIYIVSDAGIVYALNAGTGALLWTYTTGGSGWSSPAVANGVVYVGSGDLNLYALNAATGAKLWSHATIALGLFPSPIVANGVLYATALSRVFAFALPANQTEAGAASNAPDVKLLHPNLNLKMSKQTGTPPKIE